MADLIDRQDLLKRLKFKVETDTTYHHLKQRGLESAMAQVRKAPAIDAVEVVRCKDCKHWWKDAKLCVHPKCCEGCVAVVDAPPTHYCGYGERKDNG